VASIAEAIGRRSSLSSDEMDNLRTAAFLHDVGHMTMAVDGQNVEAAGHAEEGEKVVAGANFPLEVVAAVRHHHDRWDAAGKADVSVLARILAVAERFEASTAGRGCARATPKAAQDQVVVGSGTEFDPAVVEALGRAVRDGSLELNLPELAFPATAAPADPVPAAV
jgi:putative nucleotidyltransferase with HDIG domain